VNNLFFKTISGKSPQFKGAKMKKLIYIFIFMFAVTVAGQAQTTKIVKVPYTPSFQVMVKGGYSIPLSHYDDFQELYKGFPGVQAELIYDFNPCWGVYGNFSADFLSYKDSIASGPFFNGTFSRGSSTQLSGYVGPRYYINLRSAPLWKILVDAGVGIYSLKDGEFTTTTTPGGTATTTSDANTQWGVNLGAGANVVVGSRMVINFGAKYHFIFEKTNATITSTTTFSNGTPSVTTTTTGSLGERSYLQFSLGIGFRLVGGM
jgi:hypothetical protein